ncbi:MAG TPA: class I SAM-dependent methyltransferase [Pseudonocardiaceae bacterium]|jgi:SAM-dependent methyltransferase|nr:class I SAM-dependent methyltransferase [Pseudonocardiaceae bacterium]
MTDHQFADAGLAGWYDEFNNPGRPDFPFYLDLIMSAPSVLDIGCGTGALLHRAREAGHRGRLCGLDPAEGMLAQARRRSDIDWVLGDLTAIDRAERFDLVVMTGHAFQVLVTDEEVRAALGVVRGLLGGRGRFVFETRNPLVRAWERWTPDHAREIVDSDGAVVRMSHQVSMPVAGDLVSFATTFTSSALAEPQVSVSTLRFLGPAALGALLARAGLVVAEQFGDWDRSPVTARSPEIISLCGES